MVPVVEEIDCVDYMAFFVKTADEDEATALLFSHMVKYFMYCDDMAPEPMLVDRAGRWRRYPCTSRCQCGNDYAYHLIPSGPGRGTFPGTLFVRASDHWTHADLPRVA